MNTLNFNFIFLGQSVLKYQVPEEVYGVINDSIKNRSAG